MTTDEAAPSRGARAWTLIKRTALDVRDDRLVGVSAEVAFFALLAIPPLLLVLAGAAGFVGDLVGAGTRASMRDAVVEALGGFLAPETMAETVRPTVDALFERGRGGLLSIGALLALWSSSRLIKVLIEAMNIAYDVEEWRSAWKRRAVAVGLTLGGLLALAVFFPLVVAGPNLGGAIDRRFGLGGVLDGVWRVLYWPGVVVLAVSILTTLYHAAPNWRTPWRRDVPGALLAAIGWVAAAFGLRLYVDIGFSESQFGPLAAPVVLLLWLYVSAFVVLLGAELNAEIERLWPSPEAGPKEGGRAARLRERARDLATRRRRDDRDPDPAGAADEDGDDGAP